jgi:hypothetical protein
MGHKVNPIGMRLQVNRTWDSRWYADTKDFGNLLLEDLKMREFVGERVQASGCRPCDHRTSAQKVPRDDPHSTPWCDHRQERRGHRRPAQKAGTQ